MEGSGCISTRQAYTLIGAHMTPEPILPLCVCGDPQCHISYGFCHCGCGGKAPIAKEYRSKLIKRGYPQPFIKGHFGKLQAAKRRPKLVQPQDYSTRLIPLTRGFVATVDTYLYDWLNESNWCVLYNNHVKGYYATRNIPDGKGGQLVVYMHREIVGLSPNDDRQVDHQDHDGLNNKGGNLRIASNGQNLFNSRNHARGKKGYYRTAEGNYAAEITCNGVKERLGRFTTEEAAHQAYCRAAERLHGEFHCPG